MNSLKKVLRTAAVLAAVFCLAPSGAYVQQGFSDGGAGQPVLAGTSAGMGLPATGDDLGMGAIVLTALGVFCLIAAFLVLAHGIRSAKKPQSSARIGIDRSHKL